MCTTHFLIKYLFLCLGIIASRGGCSSSTWSSGLSYRTNSMSKPNFVFIMTDDQDLLLDSMEYMPFVQKHLGEKGTSYQRHYCTIAVCCPSRVSLLTGKAAHNTNVTDVFPPYGKLSAQKSLQKMIVNSQYAGGYPKFISQGLNDDYLPVWLQEAGYNTYYTGKLMNAHSTTTYNNPFPRGWNGSDCTICFLSPGYTS